MLWSQNYDKIWQDTNNSSKQWLSQGLGAPWKVGHAATRSVSAAVFAAEHLPGSVYGGCDLGLSCSGILLVICPGDRRFIWKGYRSSEQLRNESDMHVLWTWKFPSHWHQRSPRSLGLIGNLHIFGIIWFRGFKFFNHGMGYFMGLFRASRQFVHTTLWKMRHDGMTRMALPSAMNPPRPCWWVVPWRSKKTIRLEGPGSPVAGDQHLSRTKTGYHNFGTCLLSSQHFQTYTGWWFGTFFILHILGIIIPID